MLARILSPVCRGTALLVLWLLALLPAAAHAHIRLESASPAAGATLTAPPEVLRLRFAAHIEARYTQLQLTAPDGSIVPLGAVTFEPGSDREFTAAVPPLRGSGTFTVRWRTAGADGHVLEGSYTFVLEQDSAAAAVPDSLLPPAPLPEMAEMEHEHGGMTESSGSGPGDVAARWLQFVGLTLLLGAVAMRTLLLPRLALAAPLLGALHRAGWRIIAGTALLLTVAAVLRLYLQSVAMHGAENAWSTPLLTLMLNDTGWGRAWLLQVFLITLLAAAIAWARPGRDGAAAVLATLAAAGLAAIPAMSGHAAGAGRFAALVVANDALHVAAAGAWVGTLALLMTAVLPRLGREPDPARAQADAVEAFSPIALAAAAIVAGSGIINALMHFQAVSQLWATPYGRTLLVKLAFVGAAVCGGFINWRVVRPRLGGGDHARLRVVAGAELLFATLVLVATAILTGLPRPG